MADERTARIEAAVAQACETFAAYRATPEDVRRLMRERNTLKAQLAAAEQRAHAAEAERDALAKAAGEMLGAYHDGGDGAQGEAAEALMRTLAARATPAPPADGGA